MSSDDTIWQCCGKTFCSFKVKFQETVLCRNIYNVNGVCSKASCPLANSYYGTILEEHGKCYLYLKTVERAHTPRKLWEKILLSENTEKAEEQIERHMKNVYKDHQITKCKQRLLRIREYLGRMRRLALEPEKNMAYESRKLLRREENREVKALKAAKIQDSVEEELLKRLREGHYGEIYNYPAQQFAEMLDKNGEAEETDEEIERGEEDITDDEEEDMEDDLEDCIV